MSELTRFGVSVEDDLLVSFDNLITTQGYDTRSEALRDLMREALIKAKLEDLKEAGDVIGSLTLVYDHHAANLQHEMADIQHVEHSIILSVMHLHVNHDDCLEILAVRGPIARITELSDRLLCLKGIKNGKLFLTLPSSAIA
ncbi:MAG: nickel-responsive transcriptional regulator NikR [Pyrinomonadaceae bacterium]|nr:nickel-responsive transcriptional regulator NikR [Pyrinomonadaceae bacterium]MBP6213491.1 nickel-responsive transcriptional regulator NikR [Pyrinomonadaceae bacterium]